MCDRSRYRHRHRDPELIGQAMNCTDADMPRFIPIKCTHRSHAIVMAKVQHYYGARASTSSRMVRGGSSQPQPMVGNLSSTHLAQSPQVTERPPELYRLQCALSAHPYRKPSGRPTLRLVVPIDSVPFLPATTCRQHPVSLCTAAHLNRAAAFKMAAPSTGCMGTAPS
jgi:hypothetical protein